MLCLIVEILGALWLITQVIRICLKFRWLIISDKDIRMKYGHDSWAVVTGATDGIGKEFVKVININLYIILNFSN